MIGFSCQGVCHGYATAEGPLATLDDVSFSASGQEIVSVVGPSGCGKTTLLKIIAGLIAPTSGAVDFTPGKNGTRPRNAVVFQDHGVFPWLTVVDNVGFGLEMQGVPRAQCRERSRAFLHRVGLEDFAGSYPHQLSVGMRQRVGIARAFVSDFPILLLDEPFAALDAQTRLLLQEELLEIWQDERKLALFVTHDIEEAILLGDRVLVMSGRPGRIVEDIEVPLPRPRALAARERPEISEMKWHIWHHLETEARRQLSMSD